MSDIDIGPIPDGWEFAKEYALDGVAYTKGDAVVICQPIASGYWVDVQGHTQHGHMMEVCGMSTPDQPYRELFQEIVGIVATHCPDVRDWLPEEVV